MAGGTYNYRRPLELEVKFFLKGVYCTDSIYSVYRINYKIVPVTNMNKYLYYGTSGTE
jgi:hypothetical protein